MMVYLGYDACLIQGYRGYYPDSYSQHFWCEVTICGRKYVMETGNYSNNGYWSYYLCPYVFTSRYIINQKAAEDLYVPRRIGSTKLSFTSCTYNGKEQKPTVTVKNSSGKKLEKGKDYVVSYSSGRKNVGKYTVKVTYIGDYAGVKTLTYTIRPKGTSISKLTKGKQQFTVKWSKQTKQTTGYQIQYSTSSKMNNAKFKTYSNNATTSATVSGLKSGKTYYVRVRTYKMVNGSKVCSEWSSIKKVTVK